MKEWAILACSLIGPWASGQSLVANNDSFTTPQGVPLTMSAPGVLANDAGTSLTAVLVTPPSNGTLTLSTNGAFVYTPSNNFVGVDGFTYLALSGSKTSGVASVEVMVLGPGELFDDDFSRPMNDGSIFPWTRIAGKVGKGTQNISVVGGTWGITNGVMVGTGTNYTYGYAYNGDTNWTDYSVQGQIQFSGNYAASAGLLGRTASTRSPIRRSFNSPIAISLSHRSIGLGTQPLAGTRKKAIARMR